MCAPIVGRDYEMAEAMDIIAVTPRADFQLMLLFANGEKRRFDMRPLLALKPWNRVAAPSVFSLARVVCGTVVWTGGIDVAPETLYMDSLVLTD